MKKKAVIYTRVSTDAQAEKGYSLRDQEDKIRKYCDQNSIEILKHFQEDYSAKDFNRPEWKLLMAYLQKNRNEIDLFIFFKWDRFSRNMIEGFRVFGEIKSLGIEVHCLENNFDDSVPENKLMQFIMLLLPEIENKRRSLNVTAGMRRAMKEGRWPRQAPIGYKNSRDEDNNKIIIVDPLIAPLIRKAFLDMSKGNRTQQEVRQNLVKSGLKCSKNNFSCILHNQFYIGKIFIPAYKDEVQLTVGGLHMPIIEEEIFYKVQDVLSGRNKKRNLSGRMSAKPELPLRGFMLCSSCESKMTGSASKGNGGRYFYYHCNKCGERYRADDANSSFEKLLCQIELKDGIKELFKLAVTKQCKEMIDSEQRDIKGVANELKRQEQRMSRLEDSFLDGQITGSDYTELKQKLVSVIISLNLKEKELKQNKDNFSEDLSKGIDMISNIGNIYDASDLEGRQRIIGSIFPRKFIFEENRVRTEGINEVVRWVMKSSKAFLKTTKRRQRSISKSSPLVNPVGFEPTTS